MICVAEIGISSKFLFFFGTSSSAVHFGATRIKNRHSIDSNVFLDERRDFRARPNVPVKYEDTAAELVELRRVTTLKNSLPGLVLNLNRKTTDNERGYFKRCQGYPVLLIGDVKIENRRS